MAKARTTRSTAKTAAPRWRWPPAYTRVALHLSLALLLIAAGGVGFYFLKQKVDQTYLYPRLPIKVVLKDRPVWMCDLLADQIEKSARPVGLRSALDQQLLKDSYEMLRHNPWVRQVRQVRRVFGEKPGDTIEIDAEYRAPIALVAWGGYYWFVDSAGVKLPEYYTGDELPQIMFGRDPSRRQVNIRVISGIHNPPPEEGRKWPGDDLLAALDVARLLSGESFANEIWRIDVANFAGRESPADPQIVLVTDHKTRILWGEPIGGVFHAEVDPRIKLQHLAQLKQEYGRVDANHPWVNIRFDKVTYPIDAPSVRLDGSR